MRTALAAVVAGALVGNELRYMSHFRVLRGEGEARQIYYDVFLRYEP